jgi:hypothetical protein
VRDRKGHVERWEEQSNVCKNITASLPHLALDQGDQVYRVSLRNQERLEAPVVGYSCVSRLKPIPIVSNAPLPHLYDPSLRMELTYDIVAENQRSEKR